MDIEQIVNELLEKKLNDALNNDMQGAYWSVEKCVAQIIKQTLDAKLPEMKKMIIEHVEKCELRTSAIGNHISFELVEQQEGRTYRDDVRLEDIKC